MSLFLRMVATILVATLAAVLIGTGIGAYMNGREGAVFGAVSVTAFMVLGMTVMLVRSIVKLSRSESEAETHRRAQ